VSYIVQGIVFYSVNTIVKPLRINNFHIKINLLENIRIGGNVA